MTFFSVNHARAGVTLNKEGSGLLDAGGLRPKICADFELSPVYGPGGNYAPWSQNVGADRASVATVRTWRATIRADLDKKVFDSQEKGLDGTDMTRFLFPFTTPCLTKAYYL